MNQRKFAFSLAWIVTLLIATPALGQLLNHPVPSLPQGPAGGATFVAAQFARGLNDNSGFLPAAKQNSFAAAVGRSMERVSFAGMAGYIASDTDELTLAAAVAVHLLSDDSTPVQVSVQGGIGWVEPDLGAQSVSTLNFPIGVAISARPSDSGPSIRPWVMPRLNITRTGATGFFPSNTETDIAASGGVSFTSESGAGAHVALEWVRVEDASSGSSSGFSLGVGVHYVIP